jgi:hypothetical protein
MRTDYTQENAASMSFEKYVYDVRTFFMEDGPTPLGKRLESYITDRAAKSMTSRA